MSYAQSSRHPDDQILQELPQVLVSVTIVAGLFCNKLHDASRGGQLSPAPSTEGHTNQKSLLCRTVSLDVVHYFAVQTWRAGSQCHSKVNYVAICTAGITCARHFCNCWLEKWGLLWAKMWLEFWYMVYFCCLCANNWAGVSNWSSSSGIH